jgi:hypothetical protein
MDTITKPLATSASGGSKTRTPAYASFDHNTDKLSHLLKFITRGAQNFHDDLKTNIAPQIEMQCAAISKLGKRQGAEANNQVTQQCTEIAHQISDIVLKPLTQFTGGLLTIRQWIPVVLVTTVEAYLKDVRMFEARVNPTIMESSEQSAKYAEVVRSRSIEMLTEEMQSRWARNFVDDGGPVRWIDALTRMGARGYDSQASRKMEALWGVRHVIVHSAGVATSDFVRRHPDFGVKAGESIVVRPDQLIEWISVIYHFVDATDSYFAQRYLSGPAPTV